MFVCIKCDSNRWGVNTSPKFHLYFMHSVSSSIYPYHRTRTINHSDGIHKSFGKSFIGNRRGSNRRKNNNKNTEFDSSATTTTNTIVCTPTELTQQFFRVRVCIRFIQQQQQQRKKITRQKSNASLLLRIRYHTGVDKIGEAHWNSHGSI